jgi:hypothetical protein
MYPNWHVMSNIVVANTAEMERSPLTEQGGFLPHNTMAVYLSLEQKYPCVPLTFSTGESIHCNSLRVSMAAQAGKWNSLALRKREKFHVKIVR